MTLDACTCIQGGKQVLRVKGTIRVVWVNFQSAVCFDHNVLCNRKGMEGGERVFFMSCNHLLGETVDGPLFGLHLERALDMKKPGGTTDTSRQTNNVLPTGSHFSPTGNTCHGSPITRALCRRNFSQAGNAMSRAQRAITAERWTHQWQREEIGKREVPSNCPRDSSRLLESRRE